MKLHDLQNNRVATRRDLAVVATPPVRANTDTGLLNVKGGSMKDTPKAGTIMMQAGTLIPESLRVEAEPYWHGWEMIQDSDGDVLDRKVRRAGWSFFFMAENIQAMVWGFVGKKTVRRAVQRVLGKVKLSKFNCLEITEISARRFLGFPYVHVSAHSRQVQKTALL